MWRWLKVNKEHPEIYHGDPPKASEYGFKTVTDLWLADQIEKSVKREFERKT